MSFWSTLAKIGGYAAAPLTGGASIPIGNTIGNALGSAAGSMAGNRSGQFSGQMDLARLLQERDQNNRMLGLQADNNYVSNQIAREQEGRAGQQDAWRKLLSAQHTLSPTQLPTVSTYQAPMRMPTDAERSGADALTQQVLSRLQGGNPLAEVQRSNVASQYDPMSTVDPKLLKPGMLEKILGIGSAVSSSLPIFGVK
jgi:hypothetical protein